jgi:VWFA-related protein
VNIAGEMAMERLAEATGGRVLRAEKEKDIARAFQNIQQELRSQYLLGYKPAQFRSDGGYRSISVKTKHRSGLRVHVRRGYYTRPAGPI